MVDLFSRNTLIDMKNVKEKRKQHQRVRLMGDIEIKSFRLLFAQLKTAITSPLVLLFIHIIGQ